jgi:hypothetical protein
MSRAEIVSAKPPEPPATPIARLGLFPDSDAGGGLWHSGHRSPQSWTFGLKNYQLRLTCVNVRENTNCEIVCRISIKDGVNP